jgi:hypothetical protein
MSDPKNEQPHPALANLEAPKTLTALANTDHASMEAFFVSNATPTTIHNMKNTGNNPTATSQTSNRQGGSDRFIRTDHSSEKPFTPTTPQSKAEAPAQTRPSAQQVVPIKK